MDEQPVAVAVVISGQTVLVGRRVDGSPPWVFIGGKIEPGETPAAAAIREAREEAGIEVTARAELGRRVHPRTGRLLVYIECATVAPEAAAVRSPDELVELRWVEVPELDRLMPDLFGPVRDRLRERRCPGYGDAL